MGRFSEQVAEATPTRPIRGPRWPQDSPGPLMVEPQSTRFWHLAIQSGLVDAGALASCWERIPIAKRTIDAADRRLARQAIEAGFLTLWQAQQILGGRALGFKIDKYILLDRIGVGGMGRVYLARDTRLGRRVALKVLSPERMNNPRALARFQREAKVGAQLQHENLVRIYDEGDSNNVRYLVMEYIEGKTVAQLVAEVGRLPAATAAGLARQVALGLEHAYQKGLIHRDVNPSNIMVTREGTAKLTDLGLAIDLGEGGDNVTRDGATVGTFDYISPEQAQHSRNVDTRADIYSLGCTLYFMIAGRVPFPMPSLPEKLYAHQLSEPEPLSALVPGIPMGLEIVVRRMMRKVPAERYATPLAVALALDPFRGGAVPRAQIEVETPPTADLSPSQDTSGVRTGSNLGSDADLAAPARTSNTPDPSASVRPSESFTAAGPAPKPSRTPSAPARLEVAEALDEEDDEVEMLDLAEHAHQPTPVAGSGPSPRETTPAPPAEVAGLQLDFGPRTTANPAPRPGRAASPVKPAKPAKTRWPVVVGTVVATALVGLVLAAGVRELVRWIGRVANRPPAPRSIDDMASPMPSLPTGPTLFVLLPDGTKEPQDDLARAIARVADTGGEILLGGVAPRPIRAASPLVVSGKVTIRAAEGSLPSINVDMPGSTPFLQVKPGGALRLAGLTILVQYHKQASPAAVFDVAGDLDVTRCIFVAGGIGEDVRALRAEGPKTTIEDTGFRGFSRALDVSLAGGSKAILKNCLFAWNKGDDRKTGWAVRVSPGESSGKGERLLALERCTIANAGGPIEVAGFTDSAPLPVEVRDTFVMADAMLLWSSPAKDFPKALAWSGKQNRYDLQKVAWVVLPPAGFDGHPDSPTDPKSWEKALPEAGTLYKSAKFAVGPTASPYLKPADYALTDPDAAGVGIDPKLVGPSMPQ